MIYVTSDLHGCPPETLERLLRKASFTPEDFLFVLGDVIDRGKHGADLLLWLTQQSNVQLILGNHEALLLSCAFLFEEVTEESLERLTSEQFALAENWLRNGGAPTMAGLRRLLKTDPELLEGILDYLQDAPLFESLRVNGRSFILTHSGLGNFRPDKQLSDYTAEELLFTRPDPDTRYYADATVILGHTPTLSYGEEYRGRALKARDFICIDTGAALGENPMLLRLEDLREFYLNP